MELVEKVIENFDAWESESDPYDGSSLDDEMMFDPEQVKIYRQIKLLEKENES